MCVPVWKRASSISILYPQNCSSLCGVEELGVGCGSNIRRLEEPSTVFKAWYCLTGSVYTRLNSFIKPFLKYELSLSLSFFVSFYRQHKQFTVFHT